ncbi:MAG: phosphoribosyltransferase [bacterium]
MRTLYKTSKCSLYELPRFKEVRRLLVTTPETRAISNDPFILGTDYTDLLKKGMVRLFHALAAVGFFVGEEALAVILNILRGGLNFGLRGALKRSHGWTRTRSAFISSQRAKNKKGDWIIREDNYKKIPIVAGACLFVADVVATGKSLERALNKLVTTYCRKKKPIRKIIFVTIGGARAEAIMAKIDARCRRCFGRKYRGATVIYVEGVFGVANKRSKLTIAIPGTDLLRTDPYRRPATLAPEFIASMLKKPSYSLERCAIYDAGSRANEYDEFVLDVWKYWWQVKWLAILGMTYLEYLRERYPEDARLKSGRYPKKWDTSAFLFQVAEEQLEKAARAMAACTYLP